MELTYEQYSQIFRYAANEMNEKEKAFFEILLSRNEKLREELAAYREVQALCASVEQKLDKGASSEESIPSNILDMITNARREWEAEQETKVRIDASKSTVQNHVRKQTVLKWSRWPLLAAAIVVALVCLTAILYIQNKSTPTAAAPVQTNELPQSSESGGKDTSKSTVQTTAGNSTSSDNNTEVNDKPLSGLDMAQLFAAHFEPDAVPTNVATTLQEPLSFYKEKKYVDAIESFEMMKAGLDTRGSAGKAGHKRFYTHYYLGLSYLAAGKSTGRAIGELKVAGRTADNNNLQSRAQWYLALAYLKKTETREAKKILNGLVKNSTHAAFKARAFTLLQKLADH